MIRDLRKYARQTNLRLGVGFILLLMIVGIGLIKLIFGIKAALMGIICLTGGLLPLLLIGFSLWLMDEIVKRNREG